MKTPRTLTGLAVGDSSGMPFEMKEHSDPALVAWDGTFQPCPDSHPFCKGLKPGQWTDDTKMARALAFSILDAGTYSPAHAALHYLAWYKSKDWRGIGTSTKEAMKSLESGVMWAESGAPGAEGNGSAMRIAPLGLYLRKRPQSVIAQCARLDATITHNSHEAREGSVIVALCVAHLANGGTKEDMVDEVATSGHVQGCRTLGRLKDAVHYADLGLTARKSAIAIASTVLGVGGHVVETVPAAIYCFLSTSSFKEAVELAVRAGGDCDTTAAITGALAGTLYGTEGVEPMSHGLECAKEFAVMDKDLFDRGGRL